MMRSFDVAIAGLGAMGSAAARALSRRGLKVVGFDRFAPPHDLGSSHGRSRIIREAYFEHPAYVPLVQRAYLLWDEIAREAGRTLLTTTGGLMVGPRDGVLVQGALASARTHGLAYEEWSAEEIHRRIAVFEPAEWMMGVWEPRAGVLEPEPCVDAMLDTARLHGAQLRFHEPVLDWEPAGSGVRVTTERGRYHAGKLLLAAGAWEPPLLRSLALPLSVTRQILVWFEPIGGREGFEPEQCPISIWEDLPGRFFYGFPWADPGLKFAIHHEGEITDPDTVRREIDPEEIEVLRERVAPYLPRANGLLLENRTCMYTNTPDGDFVIAPHPETSAALVVSACSGHGFKFAPAIGEVVADLFVEGWTRHDLSLFGPERFAPRRPLVRDGDALF